MLFKHSHTHARTPTVPTRGRLRTPELIELTCRDFENNGRVSAFISQAWSSLSAAMKNTRPHRLRPTCSSVWDTKWFGNSGTRPRAYEVQEPYCLFRMGLFSRAAAFSWEPWSFRPALALAPASPSEPQRGAACPVDWSLKLPSPCKCVWNRSPVWPPQGDGARFPPGVCSAHRTGKRPACQVLRRVFPSL